MGLFHPKVKVELSDTEVGIVGEQTIISRLAACGYTILTPIGGAKRYDLVIEDAEGQFWRVQCKTARYHDKENAIVWNCYTVKSSGDRSKKRSYTTGEVDFYAVYFRETGKVYFVPFTHAGGKVGYLRLARKENGRSWGNGRELRAQLAEDYEI
jgi:hypothetical protein